MFWLVENLWLTVAFPALLALCLAVSGGLLRARVAWFAMSAPLLVLVSGVAVISSIEQGATVAGGSVEWILSSAGALSLGWLADGLVGLMLVVVGLVALMVMLFSVGYMADDSGIVRYYALLCLFTASMSMLVIADGLLGLFMGWELVGACSYLLIGYWFNKPSAASAAVKAFLVTRVGDVGLLLGILLLWRENGAVDYATILPAAGTLAPTVATAAAILLAVGAIGKSAQFPMQIWLPDAMEGPTPVSALIHAATMVAAGVFLIARVWPLFDVSTQAQTFVLSIGTLTALGAAGAAVAQSDIKKVLAYSTISQLGFMFAALGAGAWVVAVFHLITHAAFKAMLFLAAGSIIHGTGTQDLSEMGGLRRAMPFTAFTWAVGALALAGVFPLAGFFSKDEVLYVVWKAAPMAGVMLFVASVLTAFYITRATMLTFSGSYRGPGHPHESGMAMVVPLLVLALPAVVIGWFAEPIAEILGTHGKGIHLSIALASTATAALGIIAGVFAFRGGAEADAAIGDSAGKLWSVLRNAYGFDGVATRIVVEPAVSFSDRFYQFIDRALIDGLVEGSAAFTGRLGDTARKLQSGDVQWYVSLALTGFIALLAVSMMWERIVALVAVGG